MHVHLIQTHVQKIYIYIFMCVSVCVSLCLCLFVVWCCVMSCVASLVVDCPSLCCALLSVLLRAVAVAVAGFCGSLECLRMPYPSLLCRLTCWLLAGSDVFWDQMFFFSLSLLPRLASLSRPMCTLKTSPCLLAARAHVLQHVGGTF